MMQSQDVVLVKIFEGVISMMIPPDSMPINYQPGRAIKILDSLSEKDNSISYKNFKYPLIAVGLPIRENRGTAGGFYATARIDRIVIATHVNGFDDSERVMDKYGVNGTYTTILYPLYYEFFRCLALHPEIIGMEPNSFIHTKMDNPCQQRIGEGLSDFVDTIEILGLELTLNQIKTC